MHPDVLIIGGGIIGCSCAYYLSAEGFKVHLIDKGPLGSGASKAGMCHLVTWHEPEIHTKFAKESILLYRHLSQELPVDIEFQKTGSLSIVESHESWESIVRTTDDLQSWGINCQPLNVEDVRELEPNISPNLAGGVYYEEDALVNPLTATSGLAMAAKRMGAIFTPFTEAVSFEFNHNNNVIEKVITNTGSVSAGSVVIATGAWSGLLGKIIELEIPVTPRKGHLIVTAPIADNLINSKIVFSAGYLEAVKGGNGIAVAANVQKTKNGNLLIGTSRQFVGFDTSVDPHVISMMMERVLHIFPHLFHTYAIRCWTGFRPYTPDLLPILGPVETIDNLFIATGNEGLGITEGPITGKLIAQILSGQDLVIDTRELLLSRFHTKIEN
jgi:glycine/D-amino acid oxidase-like deaminating enzyme